jgi:hypothetical protein
LGISYFLFAASFVLLRYIPALVDLAEAFNAPGARELYTRSLARVISGFLSPRGNLLVIALVTTSGLVGTDFLWLHPDLADKYPSMLGFIKFMPNEWYMENLHWKVAIIDLYAMFVLAIIAISGRALVLNLIFLAKAGGMIPSPPYVLKAAFLITRKVANMNLEIAGHYLVGVILLFVLAYGQQLTTLLSTELPVSAAPWRPFPTIVGSLFVWGTGLIASATFLLPVLFLFRRYGRIKAVLEKQIFAEFWYEVRRSQQSQAFSTADLEHMQRFSEMLESLSTVPTTGQFIRSAVIAVALGVLPSALDISLKSLLL